MAPCALMERSGRCEIVQHHNFFLIGFMTGLKRHNARYRAPSVWTFWRGFRSVFSVNVHNYRNYGTIPK